MKIVSFNIRNRRNVVLVGGTGAGKTRLAIALVRNCIRSGTEGSVRPGVAARGCAARVNAMGICRCLFRMRKPSRMAAFRRQLSRAPQICGAPEDGDGEVRDGAVKMVFIPNQNARFSHAISFWTCHAHTAASRFSTNRRRVD
jgi:ABC-type dipeptide/oligopeptide/nickel transport system ATPase component